MPDEGKRLRGVAIQQAVRAFERAGYRLHRSSGKHYVLKCPGKPNVILPRGRLVKPGLLMHQIKQAGLLIEEFEDLMR